MLEYDICRTRQVDQPVRDILRNQVSLHLVLADNLDIDGRGQAEIKNLADDVGWLEEELNSRKQLRQLLAQVLDVFRRWPVLLLIQRYQNLRIRGSDGPAGAVSVVNGAVRHPQVIENRDQFFLRNLPP